MSASLLKHDTFYNPVDLVELIFIERDWNFDRPDEGELLADVKGRWANYSVWFAWQEELGGLSLSCSLDCKVNSAQLPRVQALLSLANERMWIGCFVLDMAENRVMFRQGVLMREGSSVCAGQMQDLIDIAIQECERFYPALQSVLWGGKTPAQAIELALFDTIAEA